MRTKLADCDSTATWEIDDFPVVCGHQLSLHGPWGTRWVQSTDITVTKDGEQVQTIYMGRVRA